MVLQKTALTLLLCILTLFASEQALNSNSRVHIGLQGNPFYQATIDSTTAAYRSKSIPATVEFAFGKKVRFTMGFGLSVNRNSGGMDLSMISDSLLTPETLDIINGLGPFYSRNFQITAGITNRLKETKRFRLNLVNTLSIFIFSDDILTLKFDNSEAIWWRIAESVTNVEYFTGFEPSFVITENFSFYTRSGLSLYWADESERVRFRVNPQPFYGGLGLRYSF